MVLNSHTAPATSSSGSSRPVAHARRCDQRVRAGTRSKIRVSRGLINPPRQSCVCTHRACVRTALINEISTGPRPNWSSGCCRGIASGALGVRSVLLVSLAVPRHAIPSCRYGAIHGPRHRCLATLREIARFGPRWRYVATADGSFAPSPDDREWPLRAQAAFASSSTRTLPPAFPRVTGHRKVVKASPSPVAIAALGCAARRSTIAASRRPPGRQRARTRRPGSSRQRTSPSPRRPAAPGRRS